MASAKRIASLKPSASIFLAVLFTFTVGASRIASQAPSFDGHPGQTAPSTGGFPAAVDREVRADMGFLASDELHGRGSATRDEHIAALFAAAQFQALGLVPGGDAGSFIQRVQLPSPLLPRVQQRLSRFEDTPRTQTWNAIAILRGTAYAAKQPGEAILLSAHLDHLGVGPANANGDSIYNGADDDASGTAAVLALARALSEGARPRRTVVFALFGSEEIGGFGDAGFLAHPPIPLGSIVANLEFEMIGRPDPAIRATAGADALWLAGFDRSDLGPELARHGAPLVADPHPSENFFQRSDNFALARQGIIAHTVSSFGLHKDYHQPSDDLAHIDFDHLVRAIASMSAPIEWLANTTWKPAWNRGGRP